MSVINTSPSAQSNSVADMSTMSTDNPRTSEQQQTIDRLLDAIEQVVIAYDMGWDIDGVIVHAAVTARDAGSPFFAEWFQDSDGSVISPAARDVLAERRRQLTSERWTPKHDDQHTICEMARAAACYAWAASLSGRVREMMAAFSEWATLPTFTALWPWDLKWWKPTTPRRDLVKAGALILAEIERLDRAVARNKTEA